MSKVLRDVGEVDVASRLAGDASRPVHPCFGTRQNKVYLIERLVLCVIVHFGRHFACMNGLQPGSLWGRCKFSWGGTLNSRLKEKEEEVGSHGRYM